MASNAFLRENIYHGVVVVVLLSRSNRSQKLQVSGLNRNHNGTLGNEKCATLHSLGKDGDLISRLIHVLHLYDRSITN